MNATRIAKRNARDRYIDVLIRRQGINATIVTVAELCSISIRGAAQIVHRRARSIGAT